VTVCPVCGKAHAICKGVVGNKYPPVDISTEVLMPEETYTAAEDVFVDKGGQVVAADDVNKMTKVVSKGGKLPLSEARKYGLAKTDGGEEGAPQPAAEGQPDEGEAIDAAEESARVQSSAGGAAYDKSSKKSAAKSGGKKK
jgi:hypothetical protein